MDRLRAVRGAPDACEKMIGVCREVGELLKVEQKSLPPETARGDGVGGRGCAGVHRADPGAHPGRVHGLSRVRARRGGGMGVGASPGRCSRADSGRERGMPGPHAAAM